VTAESQVRSQTIPFGICGGQNDSGTLLPITTVSTVTVIPPVLRTHSFVTDTVASDLGTTSFASQYSYITQHGAVVCQEPATLQSATTRLLYCRHCIAPAHNGKAI